MRVGRTVYLGNKHNVNVNNSGENGGRSLSKFFCLLLLVASAMALMYFEWNWKARNESYTLSRSETVSLRDNYISPHYANNIIHLSSAQVQVENLYDGGFNFGAPALKFKRVTEYCQWQEFSRDEEDNDGNKFRTYYYIKSWHHYRIPSLFFDQPFHHNNPQRDPMPPHEIVANTAKMGDYTLTKPIIERISSYEHFNFNRLPNAHDIFNSFTQSEAYRVHKFTSVGDGYFYSNYDESNFGFVARLAGMAMEGSLDIQLTEFFSNCNAGDIRVHFEIISPNQLSVIGKQLDASGFVGLFHMEKYHFDIGILYPGIFSADELYDKDIWDNYVELSIVRVICFILWSLFFHAANDVAVTWFSFFYFGLALNLVAWIVVRLTDFAMIAISFRNSPLLSIFLVSLLLFFATKYHTTKQQTPVNQKPVQHLN